MMHEENLVTQSSQHCFGTVKLAASQDKSSLSKFYIPKYI